MYQAQNFQACLLEKAPKQLSKRQEGSQLTTFEKSQSQNFISPNLINSLSNSSFSTIFNLKSVRLGSLGNVYSVKSILPVPIFAKHIPLMIFCEGSLCVPTTWT